MRQACITTASACLRKLRGRSGGFVALDYRFHWENLVDQSVPTP